MRPTSRIALGLHVGKRRSPWLLVLHRRREGQQFAPELAPTQELPMTRRNCRYELGPAMYAGSRFLVVSVEQHSDTKAIIAVAGAILTTTVAHHTISQV